MSKTSLRLACASIVLCSLACGGGAPGEPAPSASVGSVASEDKLANNGTALSIAVTVGVCEFGKALVVGTLTTTGSVDSADVTIAADSGPTINAFTVEPQDFVHSGKDKSFALSVLLPNGSYSFNVCASQSGSQGRLQKATCSSVEFTVSCGRLPIPIDGTGVVATRDPSAP